MFAFQIQRHQHSFPLARLAARPSHAQPAAKRTEPVKISGNQNRSKIITIGEVGHMSPARCFRAGSRGTTGIRALLALLALFSVLTARNVLPHFPGTPGAHSTVNADSHRDQRPRFDNSGMQWSAPAESFLSMPTAAESAHVTPAPQLFCTLQTKGFHFNRPPPIS